MGKKTTYNDLEKRTIELEAESWGLKKAEAELEKLDFLEEFIVNNSNIFITIMDAKGYFTYVNESFSSILGYLPEELTGMHWKDIVFYKKNIFLDKTLKVPESPQKEGSLRQIILMHKDGSRIPVVSSWKNWYKDDKLAGQINIYFEISVFESIGSFNSTLYEISKAVSTTKNLDELFHSIEQSLKKIIDTSDMNIYMYDTRNDVLTRTFCPSNMHIFRNTIHNASNSSTLNAEVIKSKKPVLIRNEQISAIYKKLEKEAPELIPPQTSKIFQGVPLIIDNEVIGVMSLRSYTDPDCYSFKDLELLEAVSDQIALAIDRKRTEEELFKAYAELEKRVRDRTSELERVNKQLELQIKEREKAEEVLRYSEEKFSKAFHSSPSMIVIRSIDDGKYIDVNEAFLRVHGFSREEVIGRNALELNIMYPAIYEEFQDMVNRRETFQNKEVDYRLCSGEARKGLASCEYMMIDGKECVLSVLHDITENMRIKEALKDSEQRYRALFENAPLPISLSTGDGKLIAGNNAMKVITGYSLEELQNINLSALYENPEERNALLKFVNRDNLISNYPIRLKHKDGHIVDTLFTMSRLISSGGKKLYQVICMDITEQVKTEAEKMGLEERLQESRKMEAIATLAGGIAHQFNNALSIILGNLELMRMGLSKNENILKYITPMKNSVSNMSHWSDQLLAYARGGKYQMETVSFIKIIRDTLPLIKHTIRDSVNLETDLPGNISDVNVDIPQIQTVIIAILSNAVEAIEGEGRILISCRNMEITGGMKNDFPDLKSGKYIRMTIMDDGKGMDEDTKNRIFEPFFSTKFHGRGLGMAAVHGIITNHNGQISIESEMEKGTSVHILLPAVTPVHDISHN